MPLTSVILLFALPVLLLLCAACAASETALFSLTHGDRVRLRRQSPRIWHAVQMLVDKPRSLIISLLLANTTAISAYLAVGGVLAGSIDAGWLGYAAAVAVPLMLMIFGEILPKALAGMHPLRATVLLAIPISWWHRLIGPLRTFLDEYLIAPLARIFRTAGAREETPLTVEELDELLTASEAGGAIDESEQRLLAEVVWLGTVRVREVMVPRVDVRWLHADAPFADVIAFLRENGQARIPVTRGASGVHSPHGWDAVGFLDTHAYLGAAERAGTGINVVNHLDAVRYVPEQARLDALLEHFRSTASHTALVVDERGDVVGMTDVESAVMPLVRASGGGGADAGSVRKVAANTWLVSGRVSVRDWADLLGKEFEAKAERVTTLGGLVQMKLGRLARAGDEVRLGGLRISVEELEGKSIRTLRIMLLEGLREGEGP